MLELGRLTEYAGEHSDVGRVLHLVDLMLVGDEEIDWAAAYSALEIIEQDLQLRGLEGAGSRLLDCEGARAVARNGEQS